MTHTYIRKNLLLKKLEKMFRKIKNEKEDHKKEPLSLYDLDDYVNKTQEFDAKLQILSDVIQLVRDSESYSMEG